MSTTPPGGSRRRRIAGERRTARPASPGSAPDGADTAVETEPAPSAEPARPAGGKRRTPLLSRTPEPAGATAAPTPEEERNRRGWGWWGSRTSLVILGVVLAAIVVTTVLAAVGLIGGQSWSEARDTRARAADWEAGESAPAAAERAAAAILSYDHRTLDADRDSALKFMTAGFGDKYKETFDKVVAPTARETSARVAADVKGSATIRASDGRVRVLVFVDQSTQSSVSETPRSALNRVEMVMVRQDGSWVVDDITSY